MEIRARELNSITRERLARGRTSRGGLSRRGENFQRLDIDGLSPLARARIRKRMRTLSPAISPAARARNQVFEIMTVAPVTYFINRHADGSGKFKGEISGHEGCRYLQNMFALRYIPWDDPVIIMNVVVVAVVSVGYSAIDSDIGFVRVRLADKIEDEIKREKEKKRMYACV